MFLKIRKPSGKEIAPYLLLKLFILPFLIVACGGTVPAPKQKPEVNTTFPADGTTGVDKGIQAITVTFSTEMDPASINKASFFLNDMNGNEIPGEVTPSGKSAVFEPAGALIPLETYTATVTIGTRDLAGDSISQDFLWSFTLSNVTDNTPPEVEFTKPANGETNVSVKISKTKISVTFSKPILGNTVIENINISLNHGAKLKRPLEGSTPEFLSDAGKTVTLDLENQLKFSTQYDIEVLGGPGQIQDTLGINLEPGVFVSTFTTKAEADDD